MECRVCGETVHGQWCCLDCYHKLREFERKRGKIESLWSNEYREQLARDYLPDRELVQFT